MNEQTAVMKDCFARSLVLPQIYSDDAVLELVHMLKRSFPEDDCQPVIEAYKSYLLNQITLTESG